MALDRPGRAFVDALLAAGDPRRLRKGQALFREGDEDDQVFLIRRGRVKIAVGTPTGRELVLAMKDPGQLIGELAALDGRPRSATATAMETTEVAAVTASRFLDLLEDEPQHALVLLRQLAAQIRTAGNRTAARASADTRTRLARQLVALAEAQDEHNAAPTTQLRLTQDDLAGWIGATREATARALGQLRAEGHLLTARGRVEIVDRDGLAAAAAARRTR